MPQFPRPCAAASRSATALRPRSRSRRGVSRTQSASTAPATTRTVAPCAACSSWGARTSGPASATRRSRCTSAPSRRLACFARLRNPRRWGPPTSTWASCTRSEATRPARATTTTGSWTYGKARMRSYSRPYGTCVPASSASRSGRGAACCAPTLIRLPLSQRHRKHRDQPERPRDRRGEDLTFAERLKRLRQPAARVPLEPCQLRRRRDADRHGGEGTQDPRDHHQSHPTRHGALLHVGHGEDEAREQYGHCARADENPLKRPDEFVRRQPLRGRETFVGHAGDHRRNPAAEPERKAQNVHQYPASPHPPPPTVTGVS